MFVCLKESGLTQVIAALKVGRAGRDSLVRRFAESVNRRIAVTPFKVPFAVGQGRNEPIPFALNTMRGTAGSYPGGIRGKNDAMTQSLYLFR